MKTIAKQLGIKDFPFEVFNNKGELIYYENSEGFWSKREYDSQGNIIYFESSGGFWWRSEYDSKGNGIYYETSYGYWWKREFDCKGNRIYFEDSDGHINDNRTVPEYTMEELVEKLGNFKLIKK